MTFNPIQLFEFGQIEMPKHKMKPSPWLPSEEDPGLTVHGGPDAWKVVRERMVANQEAIKAARAKSRKKDWPNKAIVDAIIAEVHAGEFAPTIPPWLVDMEFAAITKAINSAKKKAAKEAKIKAAADAEAHMLALLGLGITGVNS